MIDIKQLLENASPRPWGFNWQGEAVDANGDPLGIIAGLPEDEMLAVHAVNEYALHLDCEEIVREMVENPRTWGDDDHPFRKVIIDNLDEARKEHDD
jgi:hypothetical protein